MDLVQTIRKEGSRGGRGEFKWDDVKNSSHRENYLGHSLMAPVGRWQKNKDLSWYAKGDGDKELSEAEIRKAEIRKIKQAEEEAMAKALGYELPPRPEENANMTALGGGNRMMKVVKESLEGEDEEGSSGRGVGFGGLAGATHTVDAAGEVLAGTKGEERSSSSRFDKSYEGPERRRDRSREREDRHRRHDRHRSKRHRHGDHDRTRSRDRSRSRSRDRTRHRSRSRDRQRHKSRSRDRPQRRSRSRERRRSRDRDDRWRREDEHSRHDRRQDRHRRSRSPQDTGRRRDYRG